MPCSSPRRSRDLPTTARVHEGIELKAPKLSLLAFPTRRAISAISTGCTVADFGLLLHHRGFGDVCHEIISLGRGASMLLSCELDGGGRNRQAPPGGHRAARGPAHLPDARWRYRASEPGRDLAHPRRLYQRRAARCDR